MLIDYLAHHKALVPEVAELLYTEWAELFQAGGITQDALADLLVERAVIDRLPITLVALDHGRLAGTGSIKLHEPGTKPGLSPWLAGMYVKAAYRGQNVGALLVQALEQKAAALGTPTLYLSVGAARGFYDRLGWTFVENVTSYGIKEVALMCKHLDGPARGR